MKTDVLHSMIAGSAVTGRAVFDKINPVDGSLVAQVHEAGPDIVDAAVRAARNALNRPWGSMPVGRRAQLLRKVSDRIEQRADELIDAEVRDTGKPLPLARDLDVSRAAMNFRSLPTRCRPPDWTPTSPIWRTEAHR